MSGLKASKGKTTPNFRAFEKYAVFIGGGALHRFNLSDCAMIKDNHIKLAGSITEAVKKLREKISFTHKIEVECDTIEQVKEAISAGADIIMLDNMSNELMAECVNINNHKKKLEASGNMTLERINSVSKLGVDYISVGALTHSVKALDISLKFH